MADKPLLASSQLIQHMKEKGITFNIITERDAQKFIEENTYYTKLAAYRKNFEQEPPGSPRAGMYRHLEFAYLKDLSIIDLRLRYLIIHMCLDIEHALKHFLLRAIEENIKEDGYDIVKTYFSYHPEIQRSIENKMDFSYCDDFYSHNKIKLPIWVLLEVISFGELVKLYKHYYKKYSFEKKPISLGILDSVRNIRNAAAHNNCLIYSLRQNYNGNASLASYMTNKLKYKQSIVNRKLRIRFLQDFLSLLITHNILVRSKPSRYIVRKNLKELFYCRMRRNKEFYKSNPILVDTYIFLHRFLQDNFLHDLSTTT